MATKDNVCSLHCVIVIINNEFNFLSHIRSAEITRDQASEGGEVSVCVGWDGGGAAVIYQPSMSLSWQGRGARKVACFVSPFNNPNVTIMALLHVLLMFVSALIMRLFYLFFCQNSLAAAIDVYEKYYESLLNPLYNPTTANFALPLCKSCISVKKKINVFFTVEQL